MLSIKTIGASSSSHLYYAKYCQEEGESQGVWVGAGSGALGLSSKPVEADVMKELLRGFGPDGSALCKNAGDNHRGGWDMTFSAPKSWSVVWATADENLREQMEAAVHRAAEKAWSYMQEHAAYVRVGEGGKSYEKADLVGAKFFHSSNRAGEPQAHLHLVTMNLAKSRHDGQWRTLEGKFFFVAKMTAGAVFKAQLASEAQRLGFGVDRTKDSFEISGVPEKVCEAQSSRSQEIKQALLERGHDRSTASAQMKQVVTLETRSSKEKIERRKDFLRWRKEHSDLGFSLAHVEGLRQNIKPRKISLKMKTELVSDALKFLSSKKSVFKDFELHREIAEQSIGKQDADGVFETMDLISRSKEAIGVGKSGEYQQYTTAEMFQIERQMIRLSLKRQDEGRHVVGDQSLEKTLSQYPTATPEQRDVVCQVAQSRSGVSLVRGYAGAGKSFTMGILKDAYESAGYQVLGMAPTNKAKSELKTKISDSYTIDRFLMDVMEGRRKLGKRDVLVVDEAGMVESRKLKEVVELAESCGAKLVLVGDESQIQPISSGQSFGELYNRLSGVSLETVIRQHRDSEAQAILSTRSGDVLSTLRFYEGRRGVKVSHDDLSKLTERFESWRKLYPKKIPKHLPVLYTDNDLVGQLNHEARGWLVDQGQLKNSKVFENSQGQHLELSVGDQIIFTESSKSFGISRDEIARVMEIDGSMITIRDQQGHERKLDLSDFKGFQYGYAISEELYRAEKGFQLASTLDGAQGELTAKWRDFVSGEGREQTALIVASTNRAVSALNLEARSFLREQGVLGQGIEVSGAAGRFEVSTGEQLLFTKNHYKLGIDKNDILKVVQISDGLITVEKDKSLIKIDPKKFSDFKYGYAVTAHKSQGMTVDRAFVLVDSYFFDREKFYVALSRSRGFSQIFANREMLGDLSDDQYQQIREMPEGQQAYGFYRAYRDKLASSLSISGIAETSQAQKASESLEKASVRESMQDLMRRVGALAGYQKNQQKTSISRGLSS